MRITVIGHRGVVGNATYQLLSRLGYEVHGCDMEDRPVESDIAFVCLPEREVRANLLQMYHTKLYVVRSTVVPGTCEQLQRDLGVHVLHNPEFLRESSAVIDSFNPDRIIIGACCPEHAATMERLYKQLYKPVFVTDRKVSELTKLACNGWLAAVIGYWNEIDTLADALGISGTEVGMLASTDPRISAYGSRYHNRFGGKCLPKDTQHLIDIAREHGLPVDLLETIMANNCKGAIL